MTTTLRQAVNALLTGDDTLMGILLGGLHDSTEISPKGTPSAYDSRGALWPCAVLRMSARAPKEPHDEAEDAYFYIFFYQKAGGYDQIDLAQYRAKTLLHPRIQVTIDPGFVYEINHAGDLGDARDDALGCPMNYSRFHVVLLRS